MHLKNALTKFIFSWNWDEFCNGEYF